MRVIEYEVAYRDGKIFCPMTTTPCQQSLRSGLHRLSMSLHLLCIAALRETRTHLTPEREESGLGLVRVVRAVPFAVRGSVRVSLRTMRLPRHSWLGMAVPG